MSGTTIVSAVPPAIWIALPLRLQRELLAIDDCANGRFEVADLRDRLAAIAAEAERQQVLRERFLS